LLADEVHNQPEKLRSKTVLDLPAVDEVRSIVVNIVDEYVLGQLGVT
jgi:hypothetical protein